jgi:uncharacterized protein (TIGR02147 family)
MRAFARGLGISHTVLSHILSGQRPISAFTALKIASVLGWNPREKAETLQGRTLRKEPTGDGFRAIDLDFFNLVSDWYHFAILSLVELPGFQLESKWVAARLGISEAQAKIALDRLRRLGLVARKAGRWVRTGKPIKIENSISNAATRKFHSQLLERASQSLENDPMALRDFSSMTLAMDPAAVPYALKRIRAFRRELTSELEAMGKPSEVYQMTVQLFPASRAVGGSTT